MIVCSYKCLCNWQHHVIWDGANRNAFQFQDLMARADYVNHRTWCPKSKEIYYEQFKRSENQYN